MPMAAELRKLLEPEAEALPNGVPNEQQMLYSIAVSLRKLTTALLGDQPLPTLMAPVNSYGENFAVALQEGLVRGQQGISQYG